MSMQPDVGDWLVVSTGCLPDVRHCANGGGKLCGMSTLQEKLLLSPLRLILPV